MGRTADPHPHLPQDIMAKHSEAEGRDTRAMMVERGPRDAATLDWALARSGVTLGATGEAMAERRRTGSGPPRLSRRERRTIGRLTGLPAANLGRVTRGGGYRSRIPGLRERDQQFLDDQAHWLLGTLQDLDELCGPPWPTQGRLWGAARRWGTPHAHGEWLALQLLPAGATARRRDVVTTPRGLWHRLREWTERMGCYCPLLLNAADGVEARRPSGRPDPADDWLGLTAKRGRHPAVAIRDPLPRGSTIGALALGIAQAARGPGRPVRWPRPDARAPDQPEATARTAGALLSALDHMGLTTIDDGALGKADPLAATLRRGAAASDANGRWPTATVTELAGLGENRHWRRVPRQHHGRRAPAKLADELGTMLCEQVATLATLSYMRAAATISREWLGDYAAAIRAMRAVEKLREAERWAT